MSKSWYVVHRPGLVSEIDGEKVRGIILSFIKKGFFPHALLFAGPKGTGKTTTARIVAKILNCEKNVRKLGEPCNKCPTCRDIINGTSMCIVEVDAASHRGIDDVRALRETVKLMPAGGRTKVYIMDEAHMLTTEAFNALLKTLEEPPDNVVFILATTQVQKIPETIESRATLVQFSRATKAELARSLNRVIKKEKVDVEKGAVDLLISNSDGSFRDATKVLEQLSFGRKITQEDVGSFFTTNIADPVLFLKLLTQKDAKAILTQIENVVGKGINVRQFAIGLIEILHRTLLAKFGIDGDEFRLEAGLPLAEHEIRVLISLLSQAVEEMKTAPVAELPLELAVIEWVGAPTKEEQDRLRAKRDSGSDAKEDSQTIRAGGEELVVSSGLGREGVGEDKKETTASKPTTRLTRHNASPLPISDDMWRQLLAKVKAHNFSLEALLRAARPLSFDGQDVTVSVFYKFHKDKLEEENHRKVLEQILCDLLGAKTVRLFFVLGEKPKRVVADDAVIISEEKENSKGGDIAKMAEEIFGAEVHD